jgi:hypothetical protein
LLPAGEFQLYGISTRYPEKLASQIDLVPAGQGIYDLRWGVRNIRVIVLSRITRSERNAPWLMFSAVSDKVKYGTAHYQWKSPVSSIVNKLFKKYQKEGFAMPYTIEDYLRDEKEEVLRSLTKEDLDRLLKNLEPEEVFKRFDPEDRLKGLNPEDRLKGLNPEDRLKGLNPEEIEEYLRKIKRRSNA